MYVLVGVLLLINLGIPIGYLMMLEIMCINVICAELINCIT